MTSPWHAEILVDSSVWIDFYRPGGEGEMTDEVAEHLALGTVATTPVVVAEVVRGAPDEEELELLSRDFSALRWVPLDRETSTRAARIGFELRRTGKAVPATDLLVAAAALAGGCELWHQDAHFETIAGVAPLRQRRFGAGSGSG